MFGSNRNKNRGVSGVLGAIIAIGIVTTALIPLYLYTQSAAMIQQQEIEQRNIFDKERKDESLELKAYEDWYMGTHEITLKIRNTCYLAVTIVRIYVTPRNDPLKPPMDAYITIPPRSDTLEMSTGVVAEPQVIYDVKIVSERGNQYIPLGGPIYGGSGKAYPNTLSITIINMHKGWLYLLDIEALATGQEDPPEYFPVHMEWKATAENQFQSLAFGITPGKYKVSIADNQDWSEWVIADCTLPTVSNPTVVFDCSLHLQPKGNSTKTP